MQRPQQQTLDVGSVTDQPQSTSSLQHVSDVEPEMLKGRRVYRKVYARGSDLLRLDAAHPGILDGSRWVDCDLDTTVWPAVVHDVTIVDSSLRQSVWDLDVGEEIRILGTVRPRSASGVDARAPAGTAVRARVDGMRVSGEIPTVTLVQVAGAVVKPAAVNVETYDRRR